MKIRLFISMICFIVNVIPIFAQVKIEPTKSTLSGKNNLLASPISSAMLDHFNINFYTYQYASDAGGNNAKGNYNSVAVEAILQNISNELLQQITDEAYLYYVAEWSKRGITVKCPTVSDFEASKIFAKDKGKGKAEIRQGGAYPEDVKIAKYITIIPTNTAQARKEAYGNFAYGNSQFFPSDFTGDVCYLNFHLDLNFINFTTGFGTQSSVKGTAELTSSAGGSTVIWSKTKFLSAGYYNKGSGGNEYYESFDKGTPWTIKVDGVKYKTLALEIIKKSIDSMFTEYDANVAKEKN